MLLTSSRIALSLLCTENKVIPFSIQDTRCCVFSQDFNKLSSERKIRAMKTEFILCHQFSALKVSGITGNAAHRPEPHTTSANNYWKIKTVAFNCNGSSFQPLGWDSQISLECQHSSVTAPALSTQCCSHRAPGVVSHLCHDLLYNCALVRTPLVPTVYLFKQTP